MKKILLLYILSILTFTSVFSQIKFGLKAGLNLATVNKIAYSSSVNRTMYFNFGITSRQDISNKFYFSPQLLFSQKDYSTMLIPSGTFRRHLNYLSMPLYFGYKLTNGFFVQFGPEVSYLLSAEPNDVTDYYNRIEVGYSGGLNVRLIKRFYLELNYNHGLTNVIKSFGTSFPATGRNDVMQLSFSYYFK